MKPLSRRLVIAGLPLLALRCNSSAPTSGFLGAMTEWNERFQKRLFSPNKLAPEPANVSLDADVPSYFVSDALPIAPSGWALKIGGLVQRPGVFSVEDLQKLPRTDVRVRHHCVEGWSAVSSWHGVALKDLALHVGADPKTPYLEFRSFDADYYSSWDSESALHPQSILAYGRNGKPLTPEYGAPLRLYSAVKLGYKMVKYLTEVNFLPTRTGGYWEDQGYEWFAGV